MEIREVRKKVGVRSAMKNIRATPDSENVVKLLTIVRRRPNEVWPIKSFPRGKVPGIDKVRTVLREAANMGFDEFLDRCRTEKGVELIWKGTSPEDAATIAGYGTLQGFRESCKEFLGVTPQELYRRWHGDPVSSEPEAKANVRPATPS